MSRSVEGGDATDLTAWSTVLVVRALSVVLPEAIFILKDLHVGRCLSRHLVIVKR